MSVQRTIRIVSDGTPQGTAVTDEETGQVLGGITGVEWTASSGMPTADATVYFTAVPVDVVTKAHAVFLDDSLEDEGAS